MYKVSKYETLHIKNNKSMKQSKQEISKMETLSIFIGMTTFKEILKKHNIKQVDVAKILNKSKATVSKYSAGTVSPDIESYILLADYLNISLDELFDRDSNFVRISKEEYDELLKIKESINKIIK